MTVPGTIACSIDLESPGKRIGHLEVVWSDNAHAYGIIPVPIAVIAGRPGPSVLVTAGVHGDEYEGMVIARRLISDLSAEQVTGRIVIMPAVNLPAVRAGARCSPIDGENMNRAFPGNPAGPPTAAIASHIERSLLPGMSYALDLHSGGTQSVFAPCGYIYAQGPREMRERKLGAARAFGMPVTMVVVRSLAHGSLSAAAERCGVIMVAAELAGGGTLDREVAKRGWLGTLNFLRHVGVLSGPVQEIGTSLHETAGRDAFVMAPIDGLAELDVDLGDQVEAGTIAGRIWPLDDPTRPAVPVHFTSAGRVLVRRSPPRVVRGDYLCHVGQVITEAEYFAR